ncbi:sensor histidine kinase [Azospirillum sp.]|uniref:sensor histidine kinase n=1 Tax=Azospirillum sp. TaxID=34012 RepID=UPI002D6DAB3C|nr:ATP-binding protein [Azospirillum sp.]HYD67828.1 ATP-binding protein [Azospirillum sp.]
MRPNDPERVQHLLTAVTLVACGTLFAWWAVDAWWDRAQSEDQARTVLHTTQTLLREHARRSLAVVQHDLDAIAEQAVADSTPADWHEILRHHTDHQPDVLGLGLVTADGRLVAHSAMSAPDLDVSDREYFRAPRDGRPVHVGTPVVGRIASTPFFTLSQRIEAQGRFVGVAMAAIRLDLFGELYRSLGTAPFALTISVLRDDGTPIVQESEDRAPTAASWTALVRRGLEHGNPDAVGLSDEQRFYAMGRVPGLPVIVAVAADRAEVLALWRSQVLRTGSFTGLGILAIATLGTMVGRGLRRERLVLAALRRANEKLTAISREQMQARRMAEDASAAKSRLLAAVTHDLSQPLRAVRFHLEVLEREAATAYQRDLLARMAAATDLQQEMLDNLVQETALESGTLQPQPRLFAVAEVLEDIAALYRAEAARKRIDLRVVGCSLLLHSDPALLRRILLNIVSNAVRYTPSGRVLVGCRRGEEALRIEVWDTGPGIAQDDLAVIFEEFRRGAAARTEPCGLGLGLSIVRRTAAALGITVHVQSKPGHGTCFIVAIPWSDVKEPRLVRKAENAMHTMDKSGSFEANPPRTFDGKLSLLILRKS